MINIQDYFKLNREDRKKEMFKGAVEMFSQLHPQLKITFEGDEFRVEGGSKTMRDKCINEIDQFFKMCRV